MSNQLLPCPFCGAEPAPFWNGVGCVTAKCAMDGLHISIEAWNRRATQPAAGEPVAWECYEPASEWNGYKGREYLSREKPKGCAVRAVPLGRIAVPPAAAHGDDTRRIDWLACTWRLGGKLPDVDHGSFREVIDAAMRAQGDGGNDDA